MEVTCSIIRQRHTTNLFRVKVVTNYKTLAEGETMYDVNITYCTGYEKAVALYAM